MTLRTGLYRLAMQHRLDAAALRRLEQTAGLEREPAGLATIAPRVVAAVAAALGGFGLILWIAAQWDTLGRFGRFALLQAAVVAFCLAAWRPSAARPAFGLAAFLATGALFAHYGQTYQTGADAWLLFALWTALCLPLAFSLRSDLLWAPWTLVAMTALALWAQAHTGHRWRIERGDLPVHAIAALGALLLAAALSRPLQRFSGAGAIGLRVAATLAVVLITVAALGGLFGETIAPHYALGLVLLAVAAVLLAAPAAFDVYALSAVALGLDALIVGGLARLLLSNMHGEAIGPLLLLGLLGAGLVSASVSAVLRLARVHGAAAVGAP